LSTTTKAAKITVTNRDQGIAVEVIRLDGDNETVTDRIEPEESLQLSVGNDETVEFQTADHPLAQALINIKNDDRRATFTVRDADDGQSELPPGTNLDFNISAPAPGYKSEGHAKNHTKRARVVLTASG
jgi:hypothetical protein